MKKILLLFFLFFCLLLFLMPDSYAIPAFARKYRMSCQTCHSPFPRLKAYGAEFAANGFKLEDQQAPRYFVDTGDEELSLIRDIPLAFRLEGYMTYNYYKSERFDFSAPYLLKLLSGGELSQDISYYFYFFISERGDVAGIEDAFLMFNNLFSTDLDFYIGQFQVSDPLFKRELRLTFEDYQIYRAAPGYSRANLTYDRGIMLNYGMKTGTDIVLEVLNGTGIGTANSYRIFDDDKYKNFFGRVSQEITNAVRIGAFGYLGKEELENNLAQTFTNSFNMWGPDLTINVDDIWELNYQYAQRRDTQADFQADKITTKGMFGELIFTPERDASKWYAVALYNWIDSDLEELKYSAGTLTLGYMARRNIRLTAEYTYNFEGKYGQAAIGVVSAF
ncbi:MAG TPA: hypothetical protein VHO03_21090 [Ignavibacteriales bacterium]|nr:hypothetical protein [Ignavibacteriales bacterium]